MKKVMLFLAMFLFSLSASAATLTLIGVDKNGPSGFVGLQQSDDSVAVGGIGKKFTHNYLLAADEATNLKLDFKFIPANVKVSILKLQDVAAGPGPKETPIDININDLGGIGFASYGWSVLANDIYKITIKLNAKNTADKLVAYNLKVSQVPVPAAAFLFAPALAGLVALRRKAVKAA